MSMIQCDTCPFCNDRYPGKVDQNGYHFHICEMTGNIVYTIPRKEKRYTGSGYIYFRISGCGLFETADEAIAVMTKTERQRYYERMVHNDGDHDQHPTEVVPENP